MNPLIQSKNATILPVLIALTLSCFAISPARAVTPAPAGGYPNQNMAEGDGALQLLDIAAQNTAIGFNALYHNDGDGNTAIGAFALTENTEGNNNAATGVAALEFNEAGQNNTANGVAAPEGGDEQQVYGVDESAVATCVAPATGLVSWWPGDNSAEDLEGINPFTLENGATFAAGIVNKAFALDGIDDSLSAADNDSLDPGTGDFTFEFWIRTTNSGAREAVLEKRPMCGCANFYQIKMNGDGTIFSETVQDVNCTNFVTVTSTFPINDGVFHHVALTRQGVNVTLFIDGVQNATESSPTTCNLSNAAPFIVGRTVCPGERTFNGRIDELTYYTSALSPSAVQAIYTAGAAGKCKPEIFVSSITPSYEVVRHGFLVSNSVVIQDENGIAVENAFVQVKTILPSGSVLAFPVTTDATGEALITFAASETGQYRFTVRKVTHSAREYDASLNIETTDTLLIP